MGDMADDTNDNGPTLHEGENDSGLFSVHTRGDGLEAGELVDFTAPASDVGIKIASAVTDESEKAGSDSFALVDRLAEPEGKLLRHVFPKAPFVGRLARAPGGWRTLSAYELEKLGLAADERKAVVSLQELVQRGYPELPTMKLLDPSAVGRVYGARLGGLVREVMLAVALDGRNHFLAEIEIATGGVHSVAVSPRDVLRPILRCGASSFVLLHNHPSGDPTPSQRDIEFTRMIASCADAIELPFVDHVVVGARGGGFTSLLALGVLSPVA
jgi:DNA repair protein RadC